MGRPRSRCSTEVARLDAPVQVLERRLRQKHLSPVPRLAEPRSEVHVDPVVVAVLERRLAGVDPDPHAHRSVRPRVVHMTPLDRLGGGHRIGGRVERDRELVAPAIELAAVRLGERSAHERAVIGEQGGVPRTEPVRKLRRPF